jgi:O-antigen ligase/polysaccharide polymerase Wzy-like membrane protein
MPILTRRRLVVGAVATAIALGSQLEVLNRPTVLGLNHTATVVMTALGFLAIAFATHQTATYRLAWIAVFVAIPVAIFAASMVRFIFVATVASLLVAAVRSAERRKVAVMTAAICLAAIVGFGSRYNMAKVYLVNYVAAAEVGATSTTARAEPVLTPATAFPAPAAVIPSASCYDDNSLLMRESMIKEAVAALPTAGLFGHGLGWLELHSCVNSDPHNSFLQSLVEFGWIGGALFIALVAYALYRLWPLARHDDEARFALCCLAYVAMISAVSGHNGSDGLLFLFIAYSATVVGRIPQVAP